MSSSILSMDPYYSKYDTPELQTRFQKAVFNGRINKVKDLISAGENVYVTTTSTDESPLFIAIVRDHGDIVNQIVDIYEEDVEFVRNFFQSNSVKWTYRPVFVAHGSKHVELVKELSRGMEILPDHCEDTKQGMVILLKSLQAKSVLWLQPKSREDDIRIVKIFECVWNDGVLDLQHTGHWGRTLFDVAAIRYQPELYGRLLSLYRPKPEKVIEHFLDMCRRKDQKVQLEFLKNLWYGHNYGHQFDIGEILSATYNELVLPAYGDQIEIFQYFLECVADKRAPPENRETTITNILETYKCYGGSLLIETIVWADNKDFVKECLLRFKPNLLLIGNNKETILEQIISQKSSEFMTQYIVEHFDEVLANGMEYKIVKRLIAANWLDAIKSLYGKYESCRKVLFNNKEKGLKCLMSAIDGCHYDLAKYLVNAHRTELTDPDVNIQLILYCSFVERSHDVLQALLSLPASDPLKISGPEHYYQSPIYVALKFRHLKNFQLLLDNVKDLKKLRDLKEDDGENLLFAAIWFKENPVDETPFVYVEEEKGSLEVVDSSDDEEESYRKKARNKQLLTSSGPIKDPIMPDSFFEQQRLEVNRIFNYLLNEIGLDYRCTNTAGETLLHVAVKRDNYDVVQQLLRLGLDPNAKDNAGNCPTHGLRSVKVLNALRDYNCNFNVMNLVAETPLFTYVKGVTDDSDANQHDQDVFLTELLSAGADINHADENGLTVLHNAKSERMVQILLKHGAEINARNKEGETPILHIFYQQWDSLKLCKAFLRDERLDLMAVSTSGKSILSLLVTLDENTISDFLTAVAKRFNPNELNDLFKQHCNSPDRYDRPMIISTFAEDSNSYCLDKLLSMSNLDLNADPANSPIESAVHNRNLIKRLIDRGANVNGGEVGNRKTPLMFAVGERTGIGYRSYFDTIELLLAEGANVEIVDQNGDSALNYACRLENRKDVRRIVAALILANADYHRRSGEGDKLPLMDIEPFQCLYDRDTNI